MDTHHIGSILLGIGAIRADHFSTQAEEDEYYSRHTPAAGRVPSFASVGFASVAVMVCLAVVALGLTA